MVATVIVERCHAIVDTTPAWLPIVKAMECLRPGGRLVINAIRKEDRDLNSLSALNYENHLWREKEIKSVANVSRSDVREFLDLAAKIAIGGDRVVGGSPTVWIQDFDSPVAFLQLFSL